jgi:hypothetical protein
LKRKAAKSPEESGSKKVAKSKKNTGPRKPRKPKVSKKLLVNLTGEEKEKAEIEAAILKVAELQNKEKDLEDTYDCGIDPKAFVEMNSKLPPRNDAQTMAATLKIYGPIDNSKSSDTLENSLVIGNVFQKPNLEQPISIPVKCAFERIFKGVYSKKDLNLSENQHTSEPFNHLQTNPSKSQTNKISTDAAQATTSGTASIIHTVDVDEDYDATPSPLCSFC